MIDHEFDLSCVKMWWKHDEGSFEEDLKPFRDDENACALAMYIVGNNCEVEIFCKQNLSWQKLSGVKIDMTSWI